MKYKAVIFDLDGTIVNTEHIWAEATKKLIESYGIEYTPELKARLFKEISGLALCKSCAVIKEFCDLPSSTEQLMEEKSNIAMNLYKNGITFIKGFETFYTKVHNINLGKAVATSADDKTIEVTDAAVNIRKLFGEHIYGVSSVNFLYKPNPAVYLHAAKKLNIDPKECMAIDDSPFGITAAKDAGMFCIGMNTGKDKQRIKHSDIIVNDYDEIDLHKLLKE
jgi:HAD superfamily hydrolase (TIGR01509 family)